MKNEVAFKIRLNSVEAVKRFSYVIGKVDGDIDIVHERYVIDAKSIMGIFSLDLSKILKLVVRSGDEAEIATAIKEFVVTK